MTARSKFHLPTTPLAAGVCRVEASAGTGKTFTIAGLFLRLILERDLSVDEILVVTFTEAATEELRERIRRMLVEAGHVLNGGTAENSAVGDIVEQSLAHVAATVRSQANTATSILRGRVDRALRAFDEAHICTIHSFCQRTLRDHAFEGGTLFDTELVTDDSELLQTVADDYWRRRFYGADRLLVSTALHGRVSPEALVPWLRLHNRHPTLRVISDVDDRPLDTLAGALQVVFAETRAQWRAHLDELRACFLPSAPWAKGEHGKPAVVSQWLEQVGHCFADNGPTPEGFAILKEFAPESLVDNTRAHKQAPEHEFFKRCAELVTAQSKYLRGLRLDFLSTAPAALRQRKQQLKVQAYDDLLTGLRSALRGDSGHGLVDEVRRKFRAALIDEFQDTDPVQWEVFRRLFGPPEEGGLGKRENEKTGKPESGSPSLFLIGDPKQAIYGFRGADIFTYIDAGQVAPDAYTLDRNWRSESGLVYAINALFSAAPKPFVFEQIPFLKVSSAGTADEAPLREDGEQAPPLRMWFLPREPGQKEISKEFAEEKLPGVVAGEIVRLLNGNTTLGSRRLTPRDIAVLVMENRQAGLMQEALRRVGVPSVLHTEESVFASREARELARVLAALAQPGNEWALRAALAMDLMGLSGTELDAMAGDEAAWQSWLEHTRAHHDRWLAQGFMPMFRYWLHEGQVRQRLLAFEGGERRLTNLLHLAEALHAAAQERRLGPLPLARWLAEQLNAADRASEEHQLRLERDDEAVRLVTVHKSKGLEYPVVFCPFLWRASEPRRRGEEHVLFHLTPLDPSASPTPNLTLNPGMSSESKSRRESESDDTLPAKSGPIEGSDAHQSQLILDLGSRDFADHCRLAFREKLAEHLRLLYVALTRAKNRCYVVWGGFRGAGTSAAAWLLHRPRELGDDWQSAMMAHFKALNDAALRADLQRLAKASEVNGVPTIEVEPLPQAKDDRYRPQTPASVELKPRPFTGRIPTNWRISSFSGLVAASADELPDHDSEPQPATPAPAPEEAKGIFAFPRGTKAGTCLHQVFEELDFTQTNDVELRRLVESKLRRHGIPADEFAPAVCDTVRRVLATPLDAARQDFTLSRVTRSERLNELEFFLPVRELTPALLRHGLAAAGAELTARLGTLGFKPSGGFLKGFVDLVFRFEGRFYIVDWKSNWLGARVEDYGPAAMRVEMAARLYALQAHLYVVALHEYLRLRLPGYCYDEHFGGVSYIFLRGLDPARPELGVYHDRPEAGTIEALAESLRVGGAATVHSEPADQ